MILFPNQTVTHPDDVRDHVKEEYRKHASEAERHDLFIDEVLRDSFPASDAPPWTLGFSRSPVRPVEATDALPQADSRGQPGQGEET